MHQVVGWKLLIPIVAVVAVGALVVRSGNIPALKGPATMSRAGVLGYLSPREAPDSIALLSPPPEPGSAAMLRDEQSRASALSLRNSPRYVLATSDASRDQADTATAFQCAFGTEISKTKTPTLYAMLARVRIDVRAAAYPAKSRYKRPRPFVVNNSLPCNASDAQNVRNDGSYPSARGAVGWAYAEVLALVNPGRAHELLKRGEEFGESRLVCDEEWLSDVDAGRVLAEATLDRIKSKPNFQADLAAARNEAARALKASVKPPNCQSETLALSTR